MTEDNELIEQTRLADRDLMRRFAAASAASIEGDLSVMWYPGIAVERGGAWHVIADGWRMVSSHPTKAEADTALTAYRNHQVEL